MFSGLTISKTVQQFTASLLLFICFCSTAVAANRIDGIRIWPAPENTRIVFDLKNKPDYKYFSLSNPERLVIDFKHSKNSVNLKKLTKDDPRIKLIRTSTAKSSGTTRMVIELVEDYRITVFPLAPAGQYSYRLVVDLYDKKSKKQLIKKLVVSKNIIDCVLIARNEGDSLKSIPKKCLF